MMICVILQEVSVLADDLGYLFSALLVKRGFLYEFCERVKAFSYFLVGVRGVVRHYFMVQHDVL